MKSMETDPNRNDDLVAQLIQRAGRREEPPQADHDRVLAVVTGALQTKLQRRRRRRKSAWLAGSVAAAAVVAAFLLNVTPQPTQQIARIDRAIGAVDTRIDAEALWAGIRDEDQLLSDGEWLRTRPGSRVGVSLANGISLRLDGSTEVVLEAVDRVALRSGKVYVDSGKYQADEVHIDVVTAVGTATDIGTQFELRYARDKLRLRVREGQVNLERVADRLTGTAGDQLLIDATGSVQRARIAPDDPEWQWAETVAPTPELNERPVSALLDWVGRETGREIQYEQAILELKAEKTILHGSIRNLEPLKALDVMLATTDLEYSILDNGTILIRDKSKIY